MAIRVDGLHSRRQIQRAVQALGFVALLIVATGVGLTASGAFAGRVTDTRATLAHAPAFIDTPTPDPCAPVGAVVPSPNAGVGNNYLEGIGVVSANDVWAVGYYQNG